MESYFRIRAFLIGLLAGIAAFVGLFVLRSDSPYIYRGLTHEGLPFVIASAVFGLATLGALWRQFGGRRVRVLAGATVLSVLVGWGVAQYPYVLPTTLTIDQAAAPNSVLLWLLVTFIILAVTVIPTLLLLWYLDQRSRLDEAQTAGAAPPSRHRRRRVRWPLRQQVLAMGPVDVTLSTGTTTTSSSRSSTRSPPASFRRGRSLPHCARWRATHATAASSSPRSPASTSTSARSPPSTRSASGWRSRTTASSSPPAAERRTSATTSSRRSPRV